MINVDPPDPPPPPPPAPSQIKDGKIVAYVASVSVWFGRKEIPRILRHFSRGL